VDAGTFCSYVSELAEGSTTSFGNRRFFMTSNNDNANDRWKGAALWPQQSEVSKDDVKNGLFQLSDNGSDAMICGIKGGSKVLSSVRLCLQSNQCIILDETCKTLLLTDINFMGALTVPPCLRSALFDTGYGTAHLWNLQPSICAAFSIELLR
jgi:hypothetical protein